MKLSFKRNLGNLDRGIRTLLGLALLWLPVFKPIPLNQFWNLFFWVVGVFALAEAALGY